MPFAPERSLSRALALAWSACRLCRVTMLGALSCAFIGSLSCSGGSSPTVTAVVPPTAVTTNQLTFVSGDGNAPAGGVTINAASNAARQTDVHGRALLDVPVTIGAAYDATAPAQFLPRISMVRSLSEPITLWPVAPGYPAEFFQELVFNEYMPGRRLSRQTPGTTYVRLSSELQSDPEVGAAHEYAADRVTGVTNGRIHFVVTDSPPPGARVIDVSLDTSQMAGGLTFLRWSQNTILDGRITIRSLSGARNPALTTHELGHTLGLGHDTNTLPGLMALGLSRFTDFSPPERLAVAMMFQRLPGTVWPDDDRHLVLPRQDRGLPASHVVFTCNP